jgi:tRNA nucleotidyltransferase (CCA-adding enzyme)
LKHILEAAYWKPALQLLADLGALQCIHPTLKLDEELLRQLRLLERCLPRFDSQQTLIHWQMRLEALIAHLAPEYRARVARNLQLPDDGIARLGKIAQAKDRVNKMTSAPFVEAHRGGGVASEKIRPSQVVQLLRQYDVPMLILIAVQSPRVIRRKIWQYLTIWRNVQPILNGNDLQQIGYKPGPQYRQMLDDLLAATLDKVICNKTQAEEFLTKHYPR